MAQKLVACSKCPIEETAGFYPTRKRGQIYYDEDLSPLPKHIRYIIRKVMGYSEYGIHNPK